MKNNVTTSSTSVLALTFLKTLLTGLNGGYDDVHKDYKVFDIEPIRDEVLEFESVKANFEKIS